MKKSIYIFAFVFLLIFGITSNAYSDITLSGLMNARVKDGTAYITGNAGVNNSKKRVSLLVYDADKADNMREALKYVDYKYIDNSGNYSFEFDTDLDNTYKVIVNTGSSVYTDILREYNYIDDDIIIHDIFFDKVYPAEDSYVEATVYVEATKDYDEEISLLLATYKDSKLVGTTVKKFNIKKGYHAVSLGSIYVPYDDCEIRTFIWKENLVPLKNTQILENQYDTAEFKSVRLSSKTTSSYTKWLNDGIYDVYANIGLPCTIDIELNNEESICGINVCYSMSLFLKEYEIYVSNNGVDYEPVSQGTVMPDEYISMDEGSVIYFDECQAKYVRIIFNNGFKNSASLSEVKVLKKNTNINNQILQKSRYEDYLKSKEEQDRQICQDVIQEFENNNGAIFFLGTNTIVSKDGVSQLNDSDVLQKVYKRDGKIYIPDIALEGVFGVDSRGIDIDLDKIDKNFKIYNNEIILIQENEISIADEYIESVNRIYNPLKDTADELMNVVNIYADEYMLRVHELYNRDMYYHTLEEFSYNMLNRLRKYDHRGKFNVSEKNYTMKTADYLIGRLPKDKYEADILALDKTPIVDSWGVCGPPTKEVNANWAAGSGSGGYYALDFTNNLIFAYLVTKDNDYLQKYLMICEDFFENELRQNSELDDETEYTRRWNRGNTNYMHRGSLVVNTIINLARISKSDMVRASNTSYFSTVSSVLAPVSSELDRNLFADVSPESIAKIYMSLVCEYYPAIIHETKESYISNQLFSGIKALAYMCHTFTEFKYADELQYRSELAFLDFLDRNIHKDGGFLEQSFNYNVDTLDEIKSTYNLLNSKSEELKNRINSVSTMFALIAKPTGDLPRIGNYNADIKVPTDWEDDYLFGKWTSDVISRFTTYGVTSDSENEIALNIRDTLINKSETEPQFTSVTLPYSGYTALRNGWNPDSSYLFMHAARPATGHGTCGYNGIELSAFGKKMLVFGGPTWYGETDAPDDQIDEYDKFQEYFAEDSSYKANTIVIDGHDQSATGKKANTAYTTTNSNKFFTSNNFDYTEGTWQWGYKDKNETRIEDVNHYRQVFYVKDINAWIVEDTMNNLSDTESYDYVQIWGFNPEIDGAANGFSEEEIVIEDNSIITNDTEGANLAMYSFSDQELSYDLYYGSKDSDRYKGWYAKLIAGERIPKPDVHVRFFGDENSSAGLTTLIIPFETDNLLADKQKLENGFSAMIDGVEVIYQNKKGTTHEAMGIQMTGDTLLCVKKDNKLKVIALGCQRICVNANVIDASGDFELTVSEEGIVESITNITAPTDFELKATDDGYVPYYK